MPARAIYESLRRAVVPALLVPALLGLAAAACAPTFPPMAAPGGDAAFKARIATEYGPGTRADRLRVRLLGQGFVVSDDPARRLHSAVWRDDNLPCYSETRIDWREDGRGRIATIQAARHSCT